MNKTADLLDQYLSLSQDRRELLAKHLRGLLSTSNQFPSIIKTDGVCGGSARIVRTRIPLWLLQQLRRDGTSEETILITYPTLTKFDLAQAWEYIESNSQEIEQEIAANEAY